MERVTVFDIERFSFTDGPGVRTTVFFKGCNLHCPWCHNPEGIDFQKELLFNPIKCIGCGDCFKVCPNNAHILTSDIHSVNRDVCNRCFKCVDNCCSNALQVIGTDYTVGELVEILLEDEMYYKNSGGGVTVSGGEALCHADFLSSLFDELHKHGINTAIESNLSLPWEKIKTALNKTDLIMFDLKTLDKDKFEQVIGGNLDLIKSNIDNINLLNKPVIARTPIIPEFNDSAEEIENICRYLSEHLMDNLQYYELLPYHPLGAEKAVNIGKTEFSNRFSVPDKKKLNKLAEIALKFKLNVKISNRSIKDLEDTNEI